MNKCIALLLLCLIVGCDSKPTVTITNFSGVSMTIPYTVTVGRSLGFKEKIVVKRIINDIFQEVNEHYNNWNDRSEVSLLNKKPADLVTPISKHLQRLLDITKEVFALSEGRFDPTVESLRLVWREALEKNIEPTSDRLEEIRETIGFEKVHFKGGIFHKEGAAIELDLSGIAKGFAVDRLVEALNLAGYHDVLVEWGGEVRAAGRHPEERPWIVGIKKVNGLDLPFDVPHEIALFDCALATSGDYEQQWKGTQSQKIFTHVIDPFTLSPLEVKGGVVASVTVKAPTCALADGLATAAMLFPSLIEAKEWAHSIEKNEEGISFWFIERL